MHNYAKDIKCKAQKKKKFLFESIEVDTVFFFLFVCFKFDSNGVRGHTGNSASDSCQ